MFLVKHVFFQTEILRTFHNQKFSELPGKHLKNGQYTSEEDEFEFPRVIPIRASTAPPRPLTEIEEFRRSPEFMLLENTVMTSDHLKQHTHRIGSQGRHIYRVFAKTGSIV